MAREPGTDTWVTGSHISEKKYNLSSTSDAGDSNPRPRSRPKREQAARPATTYETYKASFDGCQLLMSTFLEFVNLDNTVPKERLVAGMAMNGMACLVDSGSKMDM